jgi:hypothetical protein
MIDELERDSSLDEPDRLRLRIESLDWLDAWLMDEPLQAPCSPPIEAELRNRARVLYSRLESANARLYDAIQRGIQLAGGPRTLLPVLPAYPEGAAGARSAPRGEGYDYLDELISGVFQFQGPHADGVQLATDMVRYQPTPARHIFDLIQRTALTERDVLVDLGSGLGHVSLLTAISTGAHSIGIEIEASYVECARRIATKLNLSRVAFLNQDVRAADLSAGTVFYLYTPFKGAILRAVLDSLKREGSRRPIRICSFGPCTPVIAAEPWLEIPDVLEPDRIAIFVSRS